MTTSDETGPLNSLRGLMPVFIPAKAAEILRRLGLSDITECALRTRAYRKQIPFHRNGHRIIFTLDDLKEIAEGQPCRPEQRPQHDADKPSPPPPARRRTRTNASNNDPASGVWRARRSFDA